MVMSILKPSLELGERLDRLLGTKCPSSNGRQWVKMSFICHYVQASNKDAQVDHLLPAVFSGQELSSIIAHQELSPVEKLTCCYQTLKLHHGQKCHHTARYHKVAIMWVYM